MLGRLIDTLITWPAQLAAAKLIAALEAVEDEIVAMWDGWDAMVVA